MSNKSEVLKRAGVTVEEFKEGLKKLSRAGVDGAEAGKQLREVIKTIKKQEKCGWVKNKYSPHPGPFPVRKKP